MRSGPLVAAKSKVEARNLLRLARNDKENMRSVNR